MLEDDEEERAMRAQFRCLLADWEVSTREAGLLQGVEPFILSHDLIALNLGAESERRMRLLLQVDQLLNSLPHIGVSKALWLRQPAECTDGSTRTVLSLLVGSTCSIRAIRDWLQSYIPHGTIH